jgi:methylated-DNA-[protein]-cysteine S-methyltransferase
MRTWGERMNPKKSSSSTFFDTLGTSFGTLRLIFTDGLLTGISFENKNPQGISMAKSDISLLAKRELTEYFTGARTFFTCRIMFTAGTAFEKKVWKMLREVPYGETRTYKWLAERIGKPQAFRAVGRALGKNPIPIVVPCHRIIESDGTLGGYSSGIDIKRRLLEMEYYTRLARIQ